MELSQDTLEEIFQVARQVDRGDITQTKDRDDLVRAYGLNVNSANMTIRSLRHLLKGERYRRALTLGATDYFLGRIRDECGEQGLQDRLLVYLPILITVTQQESQFLACRQSYRNIASSRGKSTGVHVFMCRHRY